MCANVIFNDCACVCQGEGSLLGGRKNVDGAQLNSGSGPPFALYYSDDHKHLIVQTIVAKE